MTIKPFTSTKVCLLLILGSLNAEARLWPKEKSSDDEPANSNKNPIFDDCPDFKPSYACVKLDGSVPPFFESVKIEKLDNKFYRFTTKLLPGLSIEYMKTEYHPDRVVRLGSDNHYPEDGPPLENLPSHETAYCDNGKLYRSEMTFLPDSTVAQELITMHVNDEGELLFELVVNGALALKASCLESVE